MKRYDLAIIGAGSGGLVAAEVAAKFGAKVILIEAQSSLGGECLHSGCVPSKALIKAARTAHSARNAKKYGIQADPRVVFKDVLKHIHSSIETIEKRSDNDAHYQEMGIDVIHGTAKFMNSHTLVVQNEQISFKKCIIATGSSPLIPSIPGLNKTPYLTNESIFEITRLPQSLTVIGGGPIAVELGQALAMLGTKVTLLVREDRLLPREEPAAADALQRSFNEIGIEVIFGVALVKVAGTTDKVTVQYNTEQGTAEISSSQLLVAAGRVPNTDLALENAGIKVSERKAIIVDERLATSAKNIYAIGDCNGGMQFTHVAAAQATIAVQNALLYGRRKNGQSIPVWTTFTTPEIAHLGATEADLKGKKKYRSYKFDYSEIDRAVAEGESGYIQILAGEKSEILGATIVGENAGEMIAQIALAARYGHTYKELGGTMMPYPTYALGIKEMSSRSGFAELLQSLPGKLIRLIT